MKKLTAKKYFTDILGADLKNICTLYVQNGVVRELNVFKVMEDYAEAKMKEISKIKK